MADFSSLLKKTSGTGSRPVALPAGIYPGIIKNHEVGDQNKNKTPYARFHLGILGWPDEISEADRVVKAADGTETPIDLSKKQMRRDFFLTDEAIYRLDDLLRSCGIQGVGERSYEELLPETTGCEVMIEVQTQFNEDRNESYNQVGKIFGPNAVG